MSELFLKDILTAEKVPLCSLDRVMPVGDAVATGDKCVSVKAQGGFRTESFVSNEDVVVSLACRSSLPLTVRVGCIRSDGSIAFDGVHPTSSVTHTEGLEYVWRSFDAMNLVIYYDAKEFFIQVECEGENTLSLEDGIIFVPNPLERLGIGAPNLEGIVYKVEAKLRENALLTADNVEHLITAPSGKKIRLTVDEDGNLSTLPLLPQKVLFVGNSLLLGMGSYGMCASSKRYDFFYHVSEGLRAKNPQLECFRAHGARYEQLEDAALFDKLWYEDPNPFTKRPLCESFTEDLDLIILQLGENVSNEKRRATLSATIDKFFALIRERSPKARIVWVHSWSNEATSGKIIVDACRRWRIGCISIADLNTKEGQAHVGQKYEKSDGSLEEVSSLWITHPGDLGMQRIAERILAYLKLQLAPNGRLPDGNRETEKHKKKGKIKMNTKYGIQMYSIRDVSSKDLREALRVVSDIGYRSVEFAGFFGHDAKDVKAWLEEYGLTAPATHTSVELFKEEDMDAIIAYHQAIGAKYIFIPCGIWRTQEDYDSMFRIFAMAQKKLEGTGIRLGYHTHATEFYRTDYGRIPFDDLCEKTDLSLEMDVFWAANGGQDVMALLERYKDRIAFIHLKDGFIGDISKKNFHNAHDNTVGTSVGSGELPIREIRAWALQNHVEIIVESEGLDPTGPEEIKRCLDFLATLEA